MKNVGNFKHLSFVLIIILISTACGRTVDFTQAYFEFVSSRTLDMDFTISFKDTSVESDNILETYREDVKSGSALLNNTIIKANVKLNKDEEIGEIKAKVLIDSDEFLDFTVLFNIQGIYINAPFVYNKTLFIQWHDFDIFLKENKEYTTIKNYFKDFKEVVMPISEFNFFKENKTYEVIKSVLDIVKPESYRKVTTTLADKEIKGFDYLINIDYDKIKGINESLYGNNFDDRISQFIQKFDIKDFESNKTLITDFNFHYYIKSGKITGVLYNTKLSLNSDIIKADSETKIEGVINKIKSPLTFTHFEISESINPFYLNEEAMYDFKSNLSKSLTKLLTRSESFQKFMGDLMYD